MDNCLIAYLDKVFGVYTPHPYLALLLSAVMGVLLLATGMGLWKFTIKFIHIISKGKFQKEVKI